MKLEHKKSELVIEKKKKMVLFGISGFLLVIDAMQALTIFALLGYAHNQHETHFIPPHISQQFSLSATGVSESYLRDMSVFLVQLRFNVTPASATYQFNSLLNYIAPSLYGEIRAQLTKEVEQIRHEHLSTVFYPVSIELDMQGLSAKVLGQMKRFVGSELMSDVKETYQFYFEYEHGLLKIKRLEQVSR